MPFKKGETPKGAKPFQKGQTGNPNGRPVGVENSRTRLLRILAITQKKKNPATGAEEEISILEQMDMALINKALKGDISAYREVLDRLEGKATQSVQATVETNSSPIQVTIVPPLPDDE